MLGDGVRSGSRGVVIVAVVMGVRLPFLVRPVMVRPPSATMVVAMGASSSGERTIIRCTSGSSKCGTGSTAVARSGGGAVISSTPILA